jgi:cell division protein FtsB
MPVAPPVKPEIRRPAGPEPLRRKRVTPVPAGAPWRRRALNYLLLFVIVVLAMDGLVGDGGLMQQLRAREVYREQRQALDALRRVNQQMLMDIGRLRDDPRAIEWLAREELGFIRPGEVLFIIKDKDKDTRPTSR